MDFGPPPSPQTRMEQSLTSPVRFASRAMFASAARFEDEGLGRLELAGDVADQVAAIDEVELAHRRARGEVEPAEPHPDDVRAQRRLVEIDQVRGIGDAAPDRVRG